jgi:hypothetical protein
MNLSSIPVTATPVRQVFFFEKTRNSSPPREHGSKNRDLRIVLPLIVSCFSRTPGFLHLVLRSKKLVLEHLHIRCVGVVERTVQQNQFHHYSGNSCGKSTNQCRKSQTKTVCSADDDKISSIQISSNSFPEHTPLSRNSLPSWECLMPFATGRSSI